MKNNIYNHKIQKNRGQMMLLAMIFLVTLSLLIVFGLSGPTVRDYKIASESLMGKQSYFLAESSIEDVYYRVKNGMTYATSETLYDGSNYNTMTVTDLGGGQKQVTSISNVSGRNRTVTSVVQTTPATTMHLNYAIQSGVGGFVLSNNSTIYGSVYSNGNIIGSNGASIQGSVYAANSQTLASDQVNDQPTTPTSSVNFGNASGTQDFGQSFQVSTTEKINKVRFYIKKTGSPSAITVRITGDSSGKPSTTTVASTSVASSLVATSYNWVEATFSSPPVLDAGATYWLVLDTSASSTKYYTLATNNSYSNGTASIGTYGGTSWTTQSSDGYFSVWLGGFTSTISGMSITGNANANTVSSSTINGNLYCQTGSGNNKTCNTSNAVPSPLSFPITTAQIDAWKAEAEVGGVTNGSLTIPSSQSLGPRKIVGDLNVDGGKILTVGGTIWVTGNITLSNNAILKLSSSYGASSGVIIADGTINLSNNSLFQGSGSSGSYVVAISTNTNAGFNVDNNAGAVIVYVPYGIVNISNNGGATQMTAETINLSNNAVINYDSSLINTTIGTGQTTGNPSIISWKESQ